MYDVCIDLMVCLGAINNDDNTYGHLLQHTGWAKNCTILYCNNFVYSQAIFVIFAHRAYTL